MEVIYFNHSGVGVSVGKTLLIFDYIKHKDRFPDLKGYDNIFVFVSHSHGDHFNPEIFKWKNFNSTFFILSYDIPMKYHRNDVMFINPGLNVKIRNMEVTAYKSNDQGCAFLADVDKKKIFHSGDLNWWHWEGEPDEDNEKMAASYKNEINKLKGKKIDIAFIPVDQRLKNERYYALDYFMDTVKPLKVYPIHFWNKTKVLDSMMNKLKNRWYYDRIGTYREEEKNEF